jgi:hypothetical protein
MAIDLTDHPQHGVLGVAALREDYKRNGDMRLLADVAEARKNGVALTEEAEAFLVEVITGSPRL